MYAMPAPSYARGEHSIRPGASSQAINGCLLLFRFPVEAINTSARSGELSGELRPDVQSDFYLYI